MTGLWRRFRESNDRAVREAIPHVAAGDVRIGGKWYGQHEDLSLLPAAERARVVAVFDRRDAAQVRRNEARARRLDARLQASPCVEVDADATGPADLPAFSIGGQYKEVTLNPPTGGLNGTRVATGGVDEDDCPDRGVYALDPNGVSIVAEES